MGRLEEYREIVKQIIREYSQFKPAYGNIEVETISDTEEEHYELVHVGWKGVERVHGSVIHVDIKDGKIWIQHDGTETGIAKELVELGIPKDKIVLGFHLPEARKYTQYAVA